MTQHERSSQKTFTFTTEYSPPPETTQQTDRATPSIADRLGSGSKAAAPERNTTTEHHVTGALGEIGMRLGTTAEAVDVFSVPKMDIGRLNTHLTEEQTPVSADEAAEKVGQYEDEPDYNQQLAALREALAPVLDKQVEVALQERVNALAKSVMEDISILSKTDRGGRVADRLDELRSMLNGQIEDVEQARREMDEFLRVTSVEETTQPLGATSDDEAAVHRRRRQVTDSIDGEIKAGLNALLEDMTGGSQELYGKVEKLLSEVPASGFSEHLDKPEVLGYLKQMVEHAGAQKIVRGKIRMQLEEVLGLAKKADDQESISQSSVSQTPPSESRYTF
jgi:hypothetical protein